MPVAKPRIKNVHDFKDEYVSFCVNCLDSHVHITYYDERNLTWLGLECTNCENEHWLQFEPTVSEDE